MFLGFDDSLKFLKKELKDAGVDVSFLRQWQKAYDRVKQQAPVLKTQYLTAKQDLERVQRLLQDMEKRLIYGATEKEAMMALVSLGYSESEAFTALKKIDATPDMDSEALLKLALKQMLIF